VCETTVTHKPLSTTIHDTWAGCTGHAICTYFMDTSEETVDDSPVILLLYMFKYLLMPSQCGRRNQQTEYRQRMNWRIVAALEVLYGNTRRQCLFMAARRSRVAA
jgi:hypothetical protein